jgi:hypothetical protein
MSLADFTDSNREAGRKLEEFDQLGGHAQASKSATLRRSLRFHVHHSWHSLQVRRENA